MTTSIRLFIFTVACVFLSGCSQTKAVSGDSHDWPMPQYEKVVGYCFEIPVMESNSLIQSEHLDSPKLARYKIAEVRLNAADVKRLIDAIYKPKIIYPVSSCHNPHHVFVFYDYEGSAVSAIEICFECASFSFYQIKSPLMQRTHEGVLGFADFAELAKLANDLGLGCGEKALEEYLRDISRKRQEDVQSWKTQRATDKTSDAD